MKIHPTLSLRISPALKESVNEKGAVAAKIIRREAPDRALIDIKGLRVRAHFPDGVPGTDTFRITHSEQKGRSLVFRILPDSLQSQQSGASTIISLLASKNPLLLRNITTPGHWKNIVELFVSSPEKKEAHRGRTAAIMNRLHAAGLPREALIDYIRLIPGGNIASILLSLQNFPVSSELLPDSFMKELKNFLENSDSPEEKADLFSLFFNTGRSPVIDTALPDGDRFTPLAILPDGDMLVLSLSLSVLGNLDIIAYKDMDVIRCAIIAENASSIDMLRKSQADILIKLKEAGLKADITIEERKNFLSDLEKCSRSVIHDRGINIRV